MRPVRRGSPPPTASMHDYPALRAAWHELIRTALTPGLLEPAIETEFAAELLMRTRGDAGGRPSRSFGADGEEEQQQQQQQQPQQQQQHQGGGRGAGDDGANGAGAASRRRRTRAGGKKTRKNGKKRESRTTNYSNVAGVAGQQLRCPMAPLGEYFRPGLWALKPFYRVIADALFVWGNAGRYHPRVLPTDAGIDSRGTGGNGGGGTGGAGSGRILDMDAFARGEQEVLAHAQQCQAVVVDTLQRVAEGMVVMGEQVGFPWNLCKKGGLCGFCGWGSRGPDVGGSIDDVHSVSSAADAITSASSSDRSEGGDDRGSLVVPRQGNIINGHGHAPRHEERLQRRPSAENARTRRRSHSRSSMILQCCVSIVEVEEQDDVEVTKRDIWEVTVPQSSLVAVEDMLSQLGERLLLHILGVRTRPVGGHIMDTSACRCPPTRDQLLRSFQAPYIPRGNSNSPAPATALAPTASTSSSRGPSTSTVSSSWTASRDSSHRAPSLGARSSQSEASYTPRSVTIAQTIDEEDEEDSYLEESTTAQTTATGDDATEPRHQQQNEQSPRRHEDDVASAATTTRRLSPEQVNLLSDDRGGSLAQWRSTNGNGAGVDSDAGVVGMGAVLTVGARRLEKMQRRSGNGWWGAPTGSVAEKNTAALSVVRRILDDALCMNIHADPSLGGKGDDVFEVRIAEGYGARWSSDGMTFRGFLDT